VFLATAGDGAIIGYLSAFAGHFLRNRGSIFIAVVGVRETWRGQGIGTRLFATVEEWARARHAWRLELRVSSLNQRGLALYYKSGFAVEGRIRAGVFRHGAWTDDFWMGKLFEPLPVPPLATPEPEPRCRARAASRPVFRTVRSGDGAAFRAWDLRLSETLPYAIKLPAEVVGAEAIERDIAAAVGDPRLWIAAVVPGTGAERIVGFGSASIEYGFRMQHDAFVNVAVLPEWAGQGIGRGLHDRLEAWARERGVRRLSAAVQAPNHAGRAFAAALGYDEEVAMRSYSLIGGRMVDRFRLGKLFA
jgi:GNAT superfamily N-acetyltransferase